MEQLADLVDALPSAEVVGDAAGVQVDGLQMRSDRVAAGDLFCCVPGGTADGHDWAPDAVARGAVALLVDHALDGLPVPQVVVPSVRDVLGQVSDRFHGTPTRQLPVFGVTGTNGKTTTTYLVDAMLAAAGMRPGTVGTVGARVGDEVVELGYTTPEAIDLQALFARMVAAGNRACAMEVSSHALDQGRTRGTRFAAVGFTNLTRDHLDYHRGFEGYYEAKRRLFTEAGPEGQVWPAVINVDDEWGSRLFDELVHGGERSVPVWGFTLKGVKRASVSGEYELTDAGALIRVESPSGDLELRSQLFGRFNVENVLCATSMALLGGCTPDHVQAGLDALAGVPGRFEPVVAGQVFDVFVDYAHTPDSLEQVLQSAREVVERRGDGTGRVIAVFGCGGDRDRSKRPVMGRAAAQGADVAIVTSDNPRSEDPDAIIGEIKRGMRRSRGEVLVVSDRREAIVTAVGQAQPGDVVLIAGKGHEQGQTFADRVVPFDDATVAREALEALAVG